MNRELTLGGLIKTKPCPLFDDELMMRNQLRKTVGSDDWWIETMIRKLRSVLAGGLLRRSVYCTCHMASGCNADWNKKASSKRLIDMHTLAWSGFTSLWIRPLEFLSDRPEWSQGLNSRMTQGLRRTRQVLPRIGRVG